MQASFMVHPFDRYAPVTDLEALNQASAKPLRKCLRVNTLKTSIDALQKHAEEKEWKLQQVPWCKEGFFIERTNLEKPLGKDPLHLLGHVYMQEASSMLPVALLDPQPKERVLDMSAAPGSKTTQIAARMNNTGVVLCNDLAEKRLLTLKTALHRSGVLNFMMTKKMGQWFGDNLIERFDRVLCDAPCTAQGTIRKDSSALDYCSDMNIGKMAKIQKQLLESAVHSCMVGGRIVYSTCTLTPEENEEVVHHIVQKYPDALEVVDPRSLDIDGWDASQTVEDSLRMQGGEGSPCIRLWPQTEDTEGFFCAVLTKTASTKERLKRYKPEYLRETPLRRKEIASIAERIEKQFGTSFIQEDETLVQLDDIIYIAKQLAVDFGLPITNFAVGIPFLKKAKDHLRLQSDLVTYRGNTATNSVIQLNEEEVANVLTGKDLSCSPDLEGDQILLWEHIPVGLGLAQNGILKNRIDRWIVQLNS